MEENKNLENIEPRLLFLNPVDLKHNLAAGKNSGIVQNKQLGDSAVNEIQLTSNCSTLRRKPKHQSSKGCTKENQPIATTSSSNKATTLRCHQSLMSTSPNQKPIADSHHQPLFYELNQPSLIAAFQQQAIDRKAEHVQPQVILSQVNASD